MEGSATREVQEKGARLSPRVLSELDVGIDKLTLDPQVECAHQGLVELGGEGSTSAEVGLLRSREEKLPESALSELGHSGRDGMKKQRFNKNDNRKGNRQQNSSRDEGTPEPSSRGRNGRDENIQSQSSSWIPAEADPSNAHVFASCPSKSPDTSRDFDTGYFDQVINILGTDVTVRVAYTGKGVENWIDECSASEDTFGLDVEWRPNFRKGEENYAALCQLSSATRCLIVQLLYMDYIPDKFKAFLADPRKKLTGVGVKGDITKLYEDYDMKCRGEVEVGIIAANVFKDPKLKQAGLVTLCATVLGIPYKKSRKITLSNWAVQCLSYNQIVYAATDAWISYSLLIALEMKQRELSSTVPSRPGGRSLAMGGTVPRSERTDEAGCEANRSQRKPFPLA